MQNEQNIGLAALAMLLAVAMPATHARQAHRTAPRLDVALEALAEVLTCTDADPRTCTIRMLP